MLLAGDTPRRAAIEVLAASWTIVREDDSPETHWLSRPSRRALIRSEARRWRRARASGPPRLSAAREAPPRRRAAAPLLI